MPKGPVLLDMKRQVPSQPAGAGCATHWVRKPPSGMRAVVLLAQKDTLGTYGNFTRPENRVLIPLG